MPGCQGEIPGFPDWVGWGGGPGLTQEDTQGAQAVQIYRGEAYKGLTVVWSSSCQCRGSGGLGLLGKPGAFLPGAALGNPSWAGGWKKRQ